MPRNRRIERMMAEIRRRGGLVGISDEMPDHAAEFFLQEILDCPDCLEEARRAGRLATPRQLSEH